jgi:hypothetical protein
MISDHSSRLPSNGASQNGFRRRVPAAMWQPPEETASEIDDLMKRYRTSADENLRPLFDRYCPSLRTDTGVTEYRKLIELTAKMQMVGHACTEITGSRFDQRRQKISSLFGACCFLGDNFLDDYGEAASREYIQRLEVFLAKGWFEIRNEREQVFYVVLSRLFFERDIFQPMLRQGLCSLFQAQKLDAELSLDCEKTNRLSRPQKLSLLRNCARDKSGHAITVLTLFLVPRISLAHHHLLYKTGWLISCIDDFGDYYLDLTLSKMTYMNQVKQPAKVLTRILLETIALLDAHLGRSRGRELLKGFLHRYFTTRLRKHYNERGRRDAAKTVYE